MQLVVYDVGKFVVFFTIILLSFSGGLLLSLKGDDDLAVHNETRLAFRSINVFRY